MNILDIIRFAVLIIDLLARLRVTVPVSITSWLRSQLHNDGVGGLPDSQHTTGTAVDLVPDNPEHNDIIAAQARALGLYARVEKDHVHIQLHPRITDIA